MADPAPDAFADLDALAAKDAHARLWNCRDGGCWSYGGAPLDARATNLRVPLENVADARVQAALTTGAWIAAVIDNLSNPVRIIAVTKAPDATKPIPRALTLADLGSAVA